MENSINFENQYKALPFLVMLYITLMLAANVLIYKLIIIGGFIMSVGSFVIPCVHVVIDIISERYGYTISKKIIFCGLISQLIFALICGFLITLPSPSFWHYQDAYDQVLGKSMRIFCGSFLGTFIGMFINLKLISKWKILIKGKYFWLRSLGASAAGQLIFTIITISYDMAGIQPAKTILGIILTSYVIKLIFTVIAATPAALTVSFLKTYEKISSYEVSVNPFKNAIQKAENPNYASP
jgi:uncharacterized integral membrane protein (TIGR00697 family)